jgi:hypothetical protein
MEITGPYVNKTTENGLLYTPPGTAGQRPFYQLTQFTLCNTGTQDVFRFLVNGGLVGGNSISGQLLIIASDNATSANQRQFVYNILSCGGGTGVATLGLMSTVVRGTEVGATANPFSLLNDGGGGAVKVQFSKNGALAAVNVWVYFSGIFA